MTERVRPVSVTVQIDAVIDDGDTLTPIRSRPVTIPARDWDAFSLDTAIAQMQEQTDPTPEATPTA